MPDLDRPLERAISTARGTLTVRALTELPATPNQSLDQQSLRNLARAFIRCLWYEQARRHRAIARQHSYPPPGVNLALYYAGVPNWPASVWAKYNEWFKALSLINPAVRATIVDALDGQRIDYPQLYGLLTGDSPRNMRVKFPDPDACEKECA